MAGGMMLQRFRVPTTAGAGGPGQDVVDLRGGLEADDEAS